METAHRTSGILRAFAGSALSAAIVAAGPVSAVAGCPPEPAPAGTCEPFGRSSVRIDAYGDFEWKASRGPSAAVAAFPGEDSRYIVCAWDEEHLVMAADVPPQAVCVSGSCASDDAVASRSDDETGPYPNYSLLELDAGDGGDARLRATEHTVGGIILPVVGALVVQAIRVGTGQCLEGFLPVESFTLDDKAAFAARFDLDR